MILRIFSAFQFKYENKWKNIPSICADMMDKSPLIALLAIPKMKISSSRTISGRTNVVLLLIVYFTISSCSSGYKIENEYMSLFQKYGIKEVIGITVFASLEPASYLLKPNEIVPNVNLIEASVPSHQKNELSYQNYKFLPTTTNFRYLGPQLISPDKSLTVVSCIKKGVSSHPSDTFQIFDNNNNQVIYTESFEKQYVINGVAWSPESDMFVLLCTKRRHTFNWNILASIAGHPASKRDWYLLFYKSTGEFIFSTKIISSLSSGYLNIVWGNKENILLTKR